MTRKIWLTVALSATVAMSCTKSPAPTPAPPVEQPATTQRTESFDAPKRIILFIGDGMGVAQLTAGHYAKGTPLEILELEHAGVMTTHEYEYLTTDSAASATAIATGQKAGYESISVKPGTTQENETQPEQHLQTLMELAQSQGLKTGLVATSRINHATPAAFGAHRAYRRSYEEIADDLSKSGLNVLLGSGSKGFDARKDGRNLFDEMKAAGWATAKSVDELNAVPADATRVAGLLTPSDFPFIVDKEERPASLANLTERAIELLDRDNPKGWVLMVEGSFVDWCAHNLDGACATMEVLDLDEAVGSARKYASKRDDTLIVVTADHETGGMSVLDPPTSEKFSKILGGEEAAAKLVQLHDATGKPVDAPPPFQHVAVGGSSAELLSKPPAGGSEAFGMTLEDARLTMVMGYFSMASRPFWRDEGRFYSAHTPTMVSIHAEGPGAGAIVDARDNADLGRFLREFVTSAGEQKEVTLEPAGKPRNVILFVGDGLGLGPITAAHYWSGGLKMTEMPVAGLSSTHATNAVVNDSAASATALASGFRTRKYAVGRRVDGNGLADVPTVLELAEQNGLSTGLVTTTAVTHATPAAFYAHRDDRRDTAGIVADLISLPDRAGFPEVIFGGGAAGFDEASRTRLTELGFAISETWPPTEGSHMLGLFAPESMARAAVRVNDSNDTTPTLTQMTQVAIEKLSADEDGFFLMVEGGQVDWRLHEGVDDTSVLAEVVEFDDALAHALRWAEDRTDTLIVVTADHDHTLSLIDNHYAFESGRCGVAKACGGPLEMQAIPVNPRALRHADGFSDTTLQGEFGAPVMYLQYAWPVQEARKGVDVHAPHSANFVPVFAAGPMADAFGGFIDQPAIGKLLIDWTSK